VFKKAASVRAVLDRDPARPLELPLPDSAEYGLRRWQAAYDAERPAPEVLQQRVDADLAAFDDEVQRERAQRLAMHGAADDDGWVQVGSANSLRLTHSLAHSLTSCGVVARVYSPQRGCLCLCMCMCLCLCL
jgi:hypothetical protein